MPGKLLTSLRNSIPAVGSTAGPTYATNVNTVLTGILDDLEPSVKAAELNINGDLEINGNNITEILAAQLAAQGSVLSGASHALKVYSTAGNLYWVNGGGTSVRITDGTGIDATNVDGIGGDYGGANPANLRYTSVGTFYDVLSDEAPNDVYAYLQTGDLRVHEVSAGLISNYVALKSPTSLGATYTWTLPGALPTSGTRLMTIDSTGVVHDTEGATTINGSFTLADVTTFTNGLKPSASSTALDHFDVGTWTPDLFIGGVSQTGLAYAVGNYLRIGDWVYFFAKVSKASASTLAGDTIAIDLPVAPAGSTDYAVQCPGYDISTITNVTQTGGTSWNIPSTSTTQELGMAGFVDVSTAKAFLALGVDDGYFANANTFNSAQFTSSGTANVLVCITGWYKIS